MRFLNCRRLTKNRIYRSFNVFYLLFFSLLNTIIILKFDTKYKKSNYKNNYVENTCQKLKEYINKYDNEKMAWIKRRINSYCEYWKPHVKENYNIEENAQKEVQINI